MRAKRYAMRKLRVTVVLMAALVIAGCGSGTQNPREVAKHGMIACTHEYSLNSQDEEREACDAKAEELEGAKEAAKEARNGHPCYENTSQEVIDECYAEKHLNPAQAIKQEAKELARTGLPCGGEGRPAEVIADCEVDGGHFK